MLSLYYYFVESNEVREFVRTFIDGIEEGLRKNYFLKGDIEFELSIVKSKTAKGGVKIFIAGVEGKYDSERVSKVKFSICNKNAYILDRAKQIKSMSR